MATQRADDDVGRLVGARLSRSAAVEVCPDAEVLAAYVDDGLADSERARLESHLATCARCRALMARLSPIEAPSSATSPVWRLPRIDARWGALAATLLVGTVLWMAWPRTAVQPESRVAMAIDAPEQRLPARAVEAGPSAPAPAAPAAAAVGRDGTRELERDATRADARVSQTLRAAAVQAKSNADRERTERAVLDAVQARQAPAAPEPAPAPPPAVAAAAGAMAADKQAVAAARPQAPSAAAAPVAPPSAAGPAAAENAASFREKLEAVGGARVIDGPSFAEPEGRLRWRIVRGRVIESSSDGGVKWNPAFDAGVVRLNSGSAPSMAAAWVCGAKGAVFRRVVPGGWTRVANPTTDDLVSIIAASDSSARVTTQTGQVFETTDGGATWAAR